ncbi:MAG: hypothetical protein LC746_08625 [Acidobacteria bacterium]|nr:hypothetical protein [Acidobacteriota bacterium]
MAADSKEIESAVEEIRIAGAKRVRTQSGARAISAGGFTPEDEEIVRPGDLITAKFINRLLRRVARLEEMIDPGGGDKPLVVPKYLGMTLSEAAEDMRRTGGDLAVGRVLDVLGNSVNHNSRTADERTVLAHFPVPDASVDFRTRVDFLVSVGESQIAPTFGNKLAAFGTDTKDIFTDVIAKFLGNELEKRVPADHFTRDQNVRGANAAKETANEGSATTEAARAAEDTTSNKG